MALPKPEARNFIFTFCYDDEIEKINVIRALTIALSRKILKNLHVPYVRKMKKQTILFCNENFTVLYCIVGRTLPFSWKVIFENITHRW